MQAETLEELQGKKLAQLKVDGRFSSSTASVEVAKSMVRAFLLDMEGKGNHDQPPGALAIDEDDRLTPYLNGRPMQDDTAFYNDNPILLPAWIQVLVHRCESEEAVQLINKLQEAK